MDLTFEELLEQSGNDSEVLNGFAAGLAHWDQVPTMASVFGLQQAQPAARLPAFGAKLPCGAVVVEWLIYPATYADQYRLAVQSAEPKHRPRRMAADQVTALLDDGTEHHVGYDEIGLMTPRMGQDVIMMGRRYGYGNARPEMVSTGDAVDSPIVVKLAEKLGTDTHLTFKAETLGDVQSACYGGKSLEAMSGLMNLTDWDVEDLSSADGWFIHTKVLPLVQKAGTAMTERVRAFEFHLKFQFTPDTPLASLLGQLNQLAKESKNVQRKQQAAARKK